MMSNFKLTRSRLIEICLTMGIVAGMVLILFPGIWKPLLRSWQSKPAQIESPSPTTQLIQLNTPEELSIPKPHWVDGKTKIARIKGSGIGYRTSLDINGDFRPRSSSEEPIITTDLPTVTLSETEAPAPPAEEWEILELQPVVENGEAIQDDDYYDVPEIRPLDISDEVVGEVVPMLTEPTPAVETPAVFAPSPTTSVAQNSELQSPWWVTEQQQPLIADRAPQAINLDQVIWMALQQAPEVQVLNTQPEVQRTVIDQSIARFDWSTFVETIWTDTNEPVDSLLDTGRSGGRFLQQEFAIEGGLKKKLATGGDLRVGQNFGRLDNNSDFLDPQDQRLSRLVVDYRQPLMKGAGQRYATTQIVLAKLQFEQTESQSLARLQEYLVEVVSAYWKLYQSRTALLLNQKLLQRAEELAGQVDRASTDQLVRVEAAVSARRSDVIRAEYEVLNAQDRLINLTVGPDSETAQFRELIPEPMQGFDQDYGDSELLTYVALRNRPEVRQAIAQMKSASAQEYVAINELLPKLDAIVSTYVAGLQGGTAGRGVFGRQFSEGDPSYSIGFGFELPVGNRAAKSRLQRQKLQTRILGQQFQKTIGDIVLDVRVAARNLERLRAEIANHENAVGLAGIALKRIHQRRSEQAGQPATSSLLVEDLLSAQNRLTLAEQRLIASQTEYAIARVDLKRATGELLNGRFHVEQFLPSSSSEQVIIHAPLPQNPSAYSPTNAPMNFPETHDFSPRQTPHTQDPNSSIESVEVTPEVITWNSQRDPGSPNE